MAKKCTTIEIEGYYGSTLGWFSIDKEIDQFNIKNESKGEFSVADVDNDYLNGCGKLIRLQSSNRGIYIK